LLMPIGFEPGEYRVRLMKQKHKAVVDLRGDAQFMAVSRLSNWHSTFDPCWGIG